MTLMPLRLLCALLLSFSIGSFAQDVPTVQQATTFANTLAPTSAKQVVNPAGVNASTWNGFTGTAITVPTNLGGFSAPTTSNATYTSAKASSLSALGTQAMVDCANYSATAASATPEQTQACAAVNFLTNQCLTPTNEQGAVLAHVGAAQTAGTNCAGTYGAGAHTFNLQNQITSNDSVFTVVKNLGATAAAAVNPICTTQNVVTTPAQYSTNLCVKSGNTSLDVCSQYLNLSVTTTRTAAKVTNSCLTGTLVGNFCQASTTGAALINYVCPVGQTLSGNQCIGPNGTTPASIASYSCPVGQTLAGSTCVAAVNTDDGAASAAPSCLPGATLNGTTCTGTATSGATYPPGQFCQDGYGDIPDVWSIAGNVCTQAYGGQDAYQKAVDAVAGCPGLDGFVLHITGIQINTVGVFRNGDCRFVTHNVPGPNPGACPLPDSSKYVLQNQTAAPAAAGYSSTTTGLCSYVPASQYSCPVGSTLDANNMCHGGTTTTAIVTNYFCPGGGDYLNGSCVTTTTTAATITYSCPAGDTLNGTQCTKVTTVTSPATPVYSCPVGATLSGSSCISPGGSTAAAVTYSCAVGAVLSGNTCTTTTTTPAQIDYSCVDGSAPLNGFCVIKTASASWTDTCGPYEASAGAILPLP